MRIPRKSPIVLLLALSVLTFWSISSPNFADDQTTSASARLVDQPGPTIKDTYKGHFLSKSIAVRAGLAPGAMCGPKATAAAHNLSILRLVMDDSPKASWCLIKTIT